MLVNRVKFIWNYKLELQLRNISPRLRLKQVVHMIFTGANKECDMSYEQCGGKIAFCALKNVVIWRTVCSNKKLTQQIPGSATHRRPNIIMIKIKYNIPFQLLFQELYKLHFLNRAEHMPCHCPFAYINCCKKLKLSSAKPLVCRAFVILRF